MTCLRLFVIILAAVRFTCTKLLAAQAFSHEFAFDKNTFKTSDEFRLCWERSKFEHRQMRMQTSSHP